MKFKTTRNKNFTKFFSIFCMILLPVVGFCQDGPPPPGDVPDVPFDSNMNLIFLAGGVLFAGVILAKRLRKKAILNNN